MADILYDTRLKSEEAPKVIILTHGDADGLVSAMIVKSFEEMENKNKTFLIMSSMDVTSEQTDKTFDYICKYTSLGSQDRVYILDRPIPSIDWLKMKYLAYTNVINIDHHLTNKPTLYKDECCCENIFFHWNDKWSAAYLTLEWFKPLVEKAECYKNLYKKLTNIRNNYIHQVTTEIVKTKPSKIVLEDLNVSGMMKNKNLAKSIADSKWFKFRQQILYKSELYGIKVILADRFYPSSKTCSSCGSYKKDLRLRDRTYKCNECGLIIDRDINAAINLANYQI